MKIDVLKGLSNYGTNDMEKVISWLVILWMLHDTEVMSQNIHDDRMERVETPFPLNIQITYKSCLL